jgi:hypothetical protein
MTKSTRRMSILDLMLLVSGAAVGLWLAIGLTDGPPDEEQEWLLYLVYILGGISTIGPPLLLWGRYRHRFRFRFRPGELLWFCQGTASWLLWPPLVVLRVQGKDGGRTMAPICYFYGTPLMALYVTIALLAGGWLRGPRRWRRARRSWTETFGLLLGLVWACTGFYLLVYIYRSDLLH